MTKYAVLLIITLLSCFSSQSQVTAQWHGPNRDGSYPDKNLLQSWPENGPPLAWSVEGIGKGYSSIVWDGTYFYTTGQKDNTDFLTAVNQKGEIAWQAPIGPSWSGSFPEARCTPTVDNGKIYVISGGGTIACIRNTDGKAIWTFDACKKFNCEYGDWGVCESLLISGNKVIYTPAGPTTTMVALDKESGETIWQTESLHDTSAYVSPTLIEHGGRKIIVTIINKYLLGVEEATGKILWNYDYSALKPEKSLKVWPGAPKTNTITPIFYNGELYITGGYDHVGAKFKLSDDASSIELVWTDEVLDCHHGGLVLVNGYLYGSNWYNNSNGAWCCVNWETGAAAYETKWNTKGSIIFADNKLYCFEEKNGNLALVNPSPEKFDLISSFKVPQGSGPAWAHPTIYNNLLLVRRGIAMMAFDIHQQ
jgi:outer membrane protein assembly factor BamB